jgi:hypothetical protein
VPSPVSPLAFSKSATTPEFELAIVQIGWIPSRSEVNHATFFASD